MAPRATGIAAGTAGVTPAKSRISRCGGVRVTSVERATSTPSPKSVTSTERGPALVRHASTRVATKPVGLAAFGAGVDGAGTAPRRAPGDASSGTTSTSIVFRSLWTVCCPGEASSTRTRATGAPSGPTASSTVTAATGPAGVAATRLATPAAVASRRSTSTVSGSGRLVTYATGSDASSTTDAPRALAFAVMLFSRAWARTGSTAANPAITVQAARAA